MKKEFIYGNSLDDILAVYSEELSGGNENNEELGFCARVIEPNKADFTKYNHQGVVDRCNTLNQNVTKETKLYFYHKNHLGSVIAISDETGNIVENYTYDVYGNILDYTESTIGNDIYYTGREFDKEIQLYYNRARYYSAKLGRFIARDPIDIVDDINLYAYVGNNPVMYVDLMGTEKVLVVGFLGRTLNSYGEVSRDEYDIHGLGMALETLKGNEKIKSKLYYSSATKFGSEKWDAKDYIIKERNNFDKLVIIGHSLGADNAVELSNSLYDDSIKVDLLLTVDLQAYNDTTKVKSNTSIAKNYYQTHLTASMNGDTLKKSKNNKTTQISNIKANNYCDIYECYGDKDLLDEKLYHTNIDDYLYSQISEDINSLIK